MVAQPNTDRVWLQPGTRAQMLIYRTESKTWQVWTATNSRTGDSRLWLGTYMELFPDGTCIQHNRTAVEETAIVVRPKYQHVERNQ
jgi:hypothetical protein